MKKGGILVSNLVFILITLVFLSVLIVFVTTKSSGGIVAEEFYAKQIALLIDSAKPGMVFSLDLENGKDVDEEWFINHYSEVVSIKENIVNVKFSENGGYSYGFFNDVAPVVEIYPKPEAVIYIRENE